MFQWSHLDSFSTRHCHLPEIPHNIFSAAVCTNEKCFEDGITLEDSPGLNRAPSLSSGIWSAPHACNCINTASVCLSTPYSPGSRLYWIQTMSLSLKSGSSAYLFHDVWTPANMDFYLKPHVGWSLVHWNSAKGMMQAAASVSAAGQDLRLIFGPLILY